MILIYDYQQLFSFDTPQNEEGKLFIENFKSLKKTRNYSFKFKKIFFKKAYESAFISNHCNGRIVENYFLNQNYANDKNFSLKNKTSDQKLNYMLEKRTNYSVLLFFQDYEKEIDLKDREALGFIIFEHLPGHALYLDIICGKAGTGSVILQSFINYANEILASSIRLHALIDVTRYYSRFGFDYGDSCATRISSSTNPKINTNLDLIEIYKGADEYIKGLKFRPKENGGPEFDNATELRNQNWRKFINFLQSKSINASEEEYAAEEERNLRRKREGVTEKVVFKCKSKTILSEQEIPVFAETCLDAGYNMILCLRQEDPETEIKIKQKLKAFASNLYTKISKKTIVGPENYSYEQLLPGLAVLKKRQRDE